MFRSLVYASVMIGAAVLPAAAQTLTEQQARGVAQALVDNFNRNFKQKNAGAIAANFTKDTVRSWTLGTVTVGRAEIEQRYAKTFEVYDEDPITFDQIKVVSDTVIVLFGSFSGVVKGDKGQVPVHGRWTWTATEPGSGEGWKIAASMISAIP